MLWFDVGIKRYTTQMRTITLCKRLWFDVGIKRYTTKSKQTISGFGCGLMQESKDIQLCVNQSTLTLSCGLMQESKDIQPEFLFTKRVRVVV